MFFKGDLVVSDSLSNGAPSEDRTHDPWFTEQLNQLLSELSLKVLNLQLDFVIASIQNCVYILVT